MCVGGGGHLGLPGTVPFTRREAYIYLIFCMWAGVQYKQQLGKIRQKAIEDMDVVKRREGLEFIDVDPAQIDFKL